MAIKTVELGGSDWVEEVLASADLNDTFNELYALSVELDYSIPPIGSILPWHKSLGTGTIPFGWHLCDGWLVNESISPLYNQNLRNLNGATDATKLFIATGTVSGTTGGTNEHAHTLDNSNGGNGSPLNSFPFSSTSTTSNLPPYFEVNFIQRYK